jgi:hypothetical protein
MDELSREVLKHFIAMGAESLDLLTLFEAPEEMTPHHASEFSMS